MSGRIDLTGKTFGRLRVKAYAGSNVRGIAKWLCRCDCGNEVAVRGDKLRLEITRSCGCMRSERMRTVDGAVQGAGRVRFRNTMPIDELLNNCVASGPPHTTDSEDYYDELARAAQQRIRTV